MERVILRHLKGSKASQVEEFPLEQFVELVMGRDPGSAVRFDPEKDDLVGRQHARVARDANDPYRFKLVDLNSRNGTFLNKLRVVGEMPIQPGDVIQLGAGGPEIQFDIDPLPAMYVKATRLGVPSPVGMNETRVGATAAPASPPAPNAVGKATVERMIGQTRDQANKKLYVGLGVAAALLIAFASWGAIQNQRVKDEADRKAKELAAQTTGNLAAVAESLRSENGRANALGAKMLPAEIHSKYAQSVVSIDFSWNLIYAPTGAQVFHRYIPNKIKIGKQEMPIIDGAGQTIPAYISVGDNEIEPWLTIDQGAGVPIAVTSAGTGFVVTSNGFILTNRHIAANWRAPYRFGQNDVGVLMDANGRVMLNRSNQPVVVNPPSKWIPSETKQSGPKQELDVFRGRQEYLYVRFRKNLNPVEATVARVSDRHDAALIKIELPSSLEPVVMHDNYTSVAAGEQVTVLGYPSISDDVVAVLKSKDTFNREAQVRVVPDPTLSVGNIGKVLRAADGPADDVYSTYAPNGDRYQLTINSTGGGNSGGPMFDDNGRVIGIFFASKRGDAAVTYAVPIKFGMELMNVGPNTK